MAEHIAMAAVMIAFIGLVGFLCWLPARYGGGERTEKRKPSYAHTTVTITPCGNIKTAPTRKPKPVPQVRANRRKKKTSRKGKK